MDNTDKFQWHRVELLFKLYYPMMRWQMIGYVALSVVVTALIAASKSLNLTIFSITAGSSVLGLAYYLAPIAFTRRDYRQVSDTLPVKASEKLVFLILYFGVITYLLLYVPMYLAQLAFPDYVPNYQEIVNAAKVDVGFNIGNWAYLTSFASAFSFITVMLWAFVTSKTNRASMIIVAFVVTMVGQGLIGGIAGFVLALNHIDEIIDSHGDITAVKEMVKNIAIIASVLNTALILVFMPMLYNKLKSRGF